MNLKSLKYFFFLMMAVITLSSCSEDDDNVSEYANWQERNEQAFADTLAYARKMGKANGWYVYKNWTFENQTPTNKDQNGNLVTLPYIIWTSMTVEANMISTIALQKPL